MLQQIEFLGGTEELNSQLLQNGNLDFLLTSHSSKSTHGEPTVEMLPVRFIRWLTSPEVSGCPPCRAEE